MLRICRLLLVALVLCSTSVFASFPSSLVYTYWTAGSATLYRDPMDACIAYAGREQISNPGYTVTITGLGTPAPYYGGICVTRYVKASYDATVNRQVLQNSSAQGCPVNSTFSGGSCTCTSPMVQNAAGTGCEAPPDPDIKACQDASAIDNSTLGKAYNDAVLPGNISSGTSVCLPTAGTSGAGVGCTANFERNITTTGPDGKQYSRGTVDTQAGYQTLPCNLVTVDPTKPVPATPELCPSGQQTGTVNGKTGCYPYGTGTTTTTAKQGTDKVTDSNGTTDVVKDSVTVCVAGKCTTTNTTTTTNTPTGGTATSSSSSTVQTQSKGEFCSANPTSKECDAAGSDDATQNCVAGDKTAGCAELGTAPDATPVVNKDKLMTLTKDTGWGPSNGTCPAPRVINLSFTSLSVPWDLMCDFASGIRPFVVGVAYVSAALTFLGIGAKKG